MGESLKKQLVLANRILANEGVFRGLGHLSVRKPDSNELYISRSLSPHSVTEDDILLMDFDGNVLSDDDRSPYIETVIHRATYRNHDNINSVIHHHDPAIMPFAITGKEVKPVFNPGALFHEGVPVFEDYDYSQYGRLVVGEEEGDRMAENLNGRQAQLLKGHGANVTGSNLKEAVVATMYLQLNAKYQYDAELFGEADYFLEPKESVDGVAQFHREELVIEREWEYLSSKVDIDI